MSSNSRSRRTAGRHLVHLVNESGPRHLRGGARHARLPLGPRHALTGPLPRGSHHLHQSRGASAIAAPAKIAVTLLLALAMIIEVIYLTGDLRANAVGPVSQADGQFLSGTALGTNLNSIVSVNPATATNNGGPQVVQTNPLSVSALNLVNVPVSTGPGVNLLGSSGILTLGAVNQYSEANPDGSSRGASGAVDSSGAIMVGGGAPYPANASLNLAPLLGGLTSSLANLTLTTGALTGRATEAANGTQTGDYQIAGLNLNLQSPLVAAVFTNLQTTLGTSQTAVNGVTALINTLLGGVATISPLPNLATIANGLTTVTSTDGSITANLQTGAVTIDVAQLLTNLGLDLNNLPPNTDLLAKITTALTTQLVPAITAGLNSVLTQITTALNGITATLGPVTLNIGNGLGPILTPVITAVTSGVSTLTTGLGTAVATPLAAALSTALSLVANAQQTAAGQFTETALRVGLLPTAPTPAAVLALASGSVGANGGPIAPPTALSLNPTSGPDTGGQTVTVTGSGFVAGATSVTIGGNVVPAAQVNVSAATTLTFSTPAHVAGPVGVTVTTSGGTITPALAYTYINTPITPPTATGLNPTSGPDSGGQTVTVTGSGFVPGGTSVTIGGNTVPAAQVNVTAATTLTFSTPPHVAGPVGVTVTTSGGTTTPALAYTYIATPGAPAAPVITSPLNGSTTTDTTPPIVGTGIAGDTVKVFEASTLLCSGVVDSGLNWTCTSSALVVGSHTIVATQTDPSNLTSGPSNAVQFSVVPLPPVITSPIDGSTITNPHPPIGGTGDPGDTVIVTVDGHQVCATAVDVNGDWVCTPASALANGQHTAIATQTSNGLTSGPSDPDTFTLLAAATHLASTGTSDTDLALIGGLLLQGGLLLLLAVSSRRSYRTQS